MLSSGKPSVDVDVVIEAFRPDGAWVALLKGRDPKYVFSREFLRPVSPGRWELSLPEGSVVELHSGGSSVFLIARRSGRYSVKDEFRCYGAEFLTYRRDSAEKALP